MASSWFLFFSYHDCKSSSVRQRCLYFGVNGTLSFYCRVPQYSRASRRTATTASSVHNTMWRPICCSGQELLKQICSRRSERWLSVARQKASYHCRSYKHSRLQMLSRVRYVSILLWTVCKSGIALVPASGGGASTNIKRIWIKVDQLDDTCFIIYCSTCFRR